MRFFVLCLSIAILFIVMEVSIASAQYRILFIHHSCGSNLFADDNGKLRQELTNLGFDVHNVTYGNKIGQETNVCHWYPKFRDQYDLIMTFDCPVNRYYQHGEENDIIMFKSCYPNSDIVSEGKAPGNPKSSKKSIWNYKATYLALAEIFAQHPEKLFIPLTAPPLVQKKTKKANADRAREFNNWLITEYLNDYHQKTGLNNIAVFDFFDVLADSVNYLKVEYQRSDTDSHPNKLGNQSATKKFLPFIKNAVSQWEATSLKKIKDNEN